MPTKYDFKVYRDQGFTDDEIFSAFAVKHPEVSVYLDNGYKPAEILGAMEGASQSKPRADESGDIARGFTTAFKQVPQLGYGIVAGAGAVAESAFGEGGVSTGIKEFGVRKYKEASADIAKDAKETDSLTYSWEQAKQGDIGALADWLQYGIGYGGAQGIQALATFGVGGLVGKAALKGSVEKLASGMVAKEAARIAATTEGKRLAADALQKVAVANVATKIGQTAGVASQAFGMEGGEIFGGLAEQSVDEGRTLGGGEIAKAFGATIAAGGLEFVTDKMGVDLVLGKSKFVKGAADIPGLKGKAARTGLGMATQMPAEAGTEYLQTGLEAYGQGDEANPLTPFQSAESRQHAFDAAGLGAVGGGVPAVVGGALSKPNQKQVADDAQNRITTAPTVGDALNAFTEATTAETAIDATELLDTELSPLAARVFGNMDEAQLTTTAADERSTEWMRRAAGEELARRQQAYGAVIETPPPRAIIETAAKEQLGTGVLGRAASAGIDSGIIAPEQVLGIQGDNDGLLARSTAAELADPRSAVQAGDVGTGNGNTQPGAAVGIGMGDVAGTPVGRIGADQLYGNAGGAQAAVETAPVATEAAAVTADENGFIHGQNGYKTRVSQHRAGSLMLDPTADAGAFIVEVRKGENDRMPLNMVLNKSGKLVVAKEVLNGNDSNGTAWIPPSEEAADTVRGLLHQRAATTAGSQERKSIDAQIQSTVTTPTIPNTGTNIPNTAQTEVATATPTRQPLAESQAPSTSEQGDASVAPGNAGGLPNTVIARVGTTPNSAEPVTVRGGVVYLGDYPAQNFETGDDIAVPAGADFAQVKQALQSAGALSSKQRVYPGVFGSKATKAAKPKPIAATSDEFGETSRKEFLQVIKKMGGITTKEARDITGEDVKNANRMNVGLFRKDGNALDLVARRLHEAGYLSDEDYNDVDGGVQAARDLINQALGKDAVMTAAGRETYNDLLQQEQRLAEREAALEEDMPARNESLAEMVADEYQDEDLPDSGETDPAAQMRMMGYTEDEINAELKAVQDSEAAGGTASGRAQEGAGTGEGQEGTETGTRTQSGFDLAGQTPAQVAAAEAGPTKAEKDADARRRADMERDHFSLQQQEKPAEVAEGEAKAKQGDLLSISGNQDQIDSSAAPKKTHQQLLDEALAGTTPLSPADKLRKQADALTKEAQKMMGGIEPGQPVRSTADRNKRDKAMEKMAKSADLLRQADELEANTKANATPAPLTKEADKESQPTEQEWQQAVAKARTEWEKMDRGQRSYLASQIGYKDFKAGKDGKSLALHEWDDLPADARRVMAIGQLAKPEASQSTYTKKLAYWDERVKKWGRERIVEEARNAVAGNFLGREFNETAESFYARDDSARATRDWLAKQDKQPKPASEMTAAELLRAAADKMDAEVAGEKAEAKPEAEQDNAPDTAIDDFGEKLGGARKDLSAAVKQEYSDDEIASLPLSKIWPADLADKIEDKFVAAFAFAARQEIPSKPRVKYKVDSWVKKVKILRDLAGLMTDSETTREKAEALLKETKSLDGFNAKITLLQSIDREQWKRIGKVWEYPNAYRYDADGKQVPSPSVLVEIDDKRVKFDGSKSVADVVGLVNGALGVEAKAKRMELEIRGRAGAYFINKKGDPLYRKLKTFTGTDEARAYMRDNYDDLVAAWEAVKDSDNVKESDLRTRENRERSAEDWRKGKDVTPEQFISEFGFRGVEFGLWVKQGKNAKERQGMLNAAYDALMDLSNIINVPPKALSLEGTLGLGFGSRGSGAASAHFEPDTLVINLTKTRGAGTLAHEFFHGLDNYFQLKRGKPATWKREEGYITYNPENYYIHNKTGFRLPERAFKVMIEGERHPEYGTISPRYRDSAQWEMKEGVRTEVGQAFADLVQALNESPMSKRASLIDKGKSGGYWSRIIERGARSFENYVIHKMMLKGYHNDYLANVTPASEFQRDAGRYPYLLEGEIQPVADAFDNLFATVQTKETDTGTAMFSRTTEQPAFYSQLSRAIESAPDKVFTTATQFKLWLNSNAAKLGIKKDEIAWSGIEDYLDMQGRVSKADVVGFLSENGTKVEDVVLGAEGKAFHDYLAKLRDKYGDGDYLDDFADEQKLTKDERKELHRLESISEDKSKFASYTPPGGIPGSYREILVTLPEVKTSKPYEQWLTENYTGIDNEHSRELYAIQLEPGKNFKSGHWDQENVLVHLRTDEVTGADGRRYLRVVELQSDWGQSFKKQKDAIKNAVDADFQGIVDKMKAAGVLEVVC